MTSSSRLPPTPITNRTKNMPWFPNLEVQESQSSHMENQLLPQPPSPVPRRSTPTVPNKPSRSGSVTACPTAWAPVMARLSTASSNRPRTLLRPSSCSVTTCGYTKGLHHVFFTNFMNKHCLPLGPRDTKGLSKLVVWGLWLCFQEVAASPPRNPGFVLHLFVTWPIWGELILIKRFGISI